MFTTKFEFLKILKTKPIKISWTATLNFKVVYKIEFTCDIRERHVYKTNGIPDLMRGWTAKKGNREEALN